MCIRDRYYLAQGKVRAMDTIKFSLTTHRGCYGECNFCSIGLHEGRKIISRSEESILEETKRITALKDFKGYIVDVGGATANMYGIDCARKDTKGACPDKRCLTPEICASLKIDHARQIRLLKSLCKIPGVKKVFVASGIRHDLVLADKKSGTAYLGELCRHHISGQLKIAPEHVSAGVLKLMGKPQTRAIIKFKNLFEKFNAEAGKKQFLTYYFIAAHPGCAEENMRELKSFAGRELKINPEQLQIFTPLPSTYSALMYWTGVDPFTGKKIFVEKETAKKERQKAIVAVKTLR